MSVKAIDATPPRLDARITAAGSSPARVVVVDVDELPDALSCEHPAGGRYAALWLLVVRDGRPLGMVEIDVDSLAIDANELGGKLRKALGDAWTREIPSRPETREGSQDLPLPSATVVVATDVGRPEQLVACVQRLADLDYPDYEIVVVDNRRATVRGEDVLQRLRGIPRVRVVRQPRPGTSAARNRGAAAATGEIVAFTDDDVEVDRRWLRALARRFVEEPDAAAVTGLVIPKELETPAQILYERSGAGPGRSFVPLSFELAAVRQSRARALSPGRFRVIRRAAGERRERADSLYATGDFGTGSNMAFRESALRLVGGFDEALGPGTPTLAGEDLAILIELLAAGRSLAYEPAAIVQHTHRRTLDGLERQMSGYGVGLTAALASLIWRDPRHLVGLIGMIPTGLRSMLGTTPPKRSRLEAGYPSRLSRTELIGMLRGPMAYVSSRRAQQRWA